jgi:hypothetical protein
MSSTLECFELLWKFVPDLSLQDHILLQHFYIGLTKESRAYLNVTSHGSFIHLTSRALISCSPFGITFYTNSMYNQWNPL